MAIKDVEELKQKLDEYDETESDDLVKEILEFASKNPSLYIHELIYGEPPIILGR